MTPTFSYYTYRSNRRRSNFLKCLTFFLTTFLIVIGVAFFGAIGLVKLRYSHPGITIPDVCVITLASFMCVVALLGYWTTCHSNSVLVKTFIASLAVVTCMIIMVDVVLFTQPELTHDLLTTLWPQLNDHGRIQFQKLLHCCDVTSSAARGNETKWASSFHKSCFEEDEGGEMGEWVIEGTPSHQRGTHFHHSRRRRLGCFTVIIQLIHDNLYMISGVIGGVIALNVILVLISCARLVGNSETSLKSRYSSFPVVTDVILWKRRTKQRLKQIESGIFELPPTYPTEPILQAYKNSIEKSLKYYE